LEHNYSHDWINTSGKVALTGENIRFEQYFELEDRWYEITVYSEAWLFCCGIPGYYRVQEN